MKKTLTSSVAVAALCSSAAFAEDVTVFGPWLGPDQELVEAVLSDFAEKSGHNVSYVGSDSFEQQIVDAAHRLVVNTVGERDELVRLRRENRQLRLERDILSRATAWFARETGAVPSGSSGS